MSDVHVSDETLEAWFAGAASEYEVPAEAFERALAAAGESGQRKPARFQHPRLVAAAVLVIAAVGGATLWGGFGHGPGSSSTSALEAGPATINNGTAGEVQHAGVVPAAPGGATAFSDDNSKRAAITSGGGNAAVTPAPAPADRALGSTDAVVKGSAGSADGAKVVHTGSMTLEVAKGQVSDTLSRLTGLASGVQGYVSSSTTSESGNRPTGTVVLRVPADSFDSVLQQVRQLGKVIATTSKGVDVTAQAADEQAKITSLKKARDQFLLILAKAKTIGETLSVQQRVDDTQSQIDQLQGQLNVLSDQASYGTMSVTVTQHVTALAVPTKVVHHQSGLSKAWHRAVDGFVTGVEALIARSGRAVLVLIVLVICAGVLRAAWKVGRRRLV